MENLTSTVFSPAIKNGVVSWCEGDVFDFTLKISLAALGENVNDLTGYTLAACFSDRTGRIVHTFTQSGDATSKMTLSFTSAVSGAFPKGRYNFDVCITTPDGKRATIANDVPVIVI